MISQHEQSEIAEKVVQRLRDRGCFGTISMDTIRTAIDVTLEHLGIEVGRSGGSR